ncbi:MAG: PAS domain S-box protein, partial [Deltaproteobacteria bacterium]|nr:PAS domain S-box protein [Deltaproteobacteria bacterium]
SQTLDALGQVLIQDPRLRAALKARDRKRLLSDYQPVFTKLKADHGLTHFYFISTDRVCLLRVHKPEKHGDLIDRFTMREAKRSGRTAAGIELGPLGTFTLRSVQPVYEENALIGYLELGKEIENILSHLHKKDNIDITVVIHKDALHRTTWEAGMKMLGRKADWNRFTSDVLIYSSLPRFPVELEHFIGKERNKHNQVSREEVFGSQPWKISVTPLLDVSGTDVGDILILYNISAAKASYHQVMIIAIGAGLLTLGVLFGFLFFLLGRIDRNIIIQQTALRESEEKFRTLAITSPTAIFIHQQGTFVYANPAALEISGYALDEILQMKFWELVHPDIREQVKNFGQQREAGADIPQRYEMKIITKQGDMKWLDFNAATIDFNGKPAIMGNVIDITDNKKGERELLTEKERLAVTLSSIGDGVIAVDLSGKITLMNTVAEEITGWTADIALGRNLAVVLSLTTENNSEPPVNLLQQVQKTGAPCYRQELVSIYSDDGEEKIIADSAAPIRDQDGKIIGIIIVIRDITEKVRIGKELETTQKLESIG